jgi:hypothetical protein
MFSEGRNPLPAPSQGATVRNITFAIFDELPPEGIALLTPSPPFCEVRL